MKRMVTVRNKTGSDVGFGNRSIPPFGSMHMSFGEYSSVVKSGSFQRWGIDVDVRKVDFKSVSVMDFGAVGDGVSDDTYQFQSAVDYVAGNGGGVVNVPVGVFLVSNIVVSGNVMLVGESKTDSVIRSGASGMSAVTFVGGECGAKGIRMVAR